ncbi:uncharacterized protein (TIGR00369 family) [Rubricella aquisinus]|uniref:Medium/long-chain acyl-CoA thioesterase YigI n=1 Tax=Rubricella aquisinus TaxID=2028108 RepID=A0A840X5G8_9RHOB|nr:PaaI family thioesterase [Rubricella aquisinus]MBB5515947.1 uncharacterized protein (TIGR00369 family) [Rubricella aquisinus]
MSQPFTPSDPDYVARGRRLFAQQGIMATLQGQVDEIAPGAVTLSAPIRPETSQQHGYAHAGFTWTMGDSAAGFAAQTLLTATQGVLTTEMKINLLAPAKGERLIARGKVERAGRRLIVVRADIAARAGTVETHVAIMLGTIMVMEGLE